MGASITNLGSSDFHGYLNGRLILLALDPQKCRKTAGRFEKLHLNHEY
jgi:hypothetical protein